MYDRRNDYLKRRGIERSQNRQRYSKAYNRPRNVNNDYNSNNDYNDYRYGSRDYNDYHYENNHFNSDPYSMRYTYDYNSGRDYRDYRDYQGSQDYKGYDNYEQEYYKHLDKWINKLKLKDRFNVNKDQIIMQAKNMGVNFNDFDEKEFYVIYLMHVADYPNVSNEYNMYISMAKSWLEDDDLNISPSEKVAKYLYSIVLGED